MGLIRKLFGSHGGSAEISGGDGSSPRNAVVITSASPLKVNQLVDDYICSAHGKKDRDWKLISMSFVSDDSSGSGVFQQIHVQTRDGENRRYYFDIGGSVAALTAKHQK